MPAWITITADDLNEARVAELVDALRTQALGAGQADPMPGIIAKVVNEVRSCIGFCAATVVDIDPATVAANLKDMVVQKIIRTMKGRLLMPLLKDESDEEDEYQKRLLLLTECRWPVDKTDTPISITPTQAHSGSPLIKPKCERVPRDYDV